jgi:glycosyltransferase involved in cell wall biosynthesis
MKKFFFLQLFSCVIVITQINAVGNVIINDFGVSPYIKKKSNTPKILRILTAQKFGGVETQTVNAYKYFLNKGYNINLLVADKSGIKKRLLEEGLPFSSIRSKKNLKRALVRKYSKRYLDIIHCHKGDEYSVVRDFSKQLGISCIAHYHSHNFPRPNLFKGFDAFIASSPKIFNFMQEANREEGLGIKYIEFIPPPHDEDKFLNFTPVESRTDFFKNNFNIRIGNGPVVLMIANLFKYKNHTLLLNAISYLIHNDKISVEVVLAGGEGDIYLESLEQLAEKLKISRHVHFLGFTERIPELLYYSDINVLCSLNEAFGIVLLEAALMKKPIILSHSADLAGILINDEKTGLLCDSEDYRHLASQIKRLIRDRDFARKLGKNVFDLVINKFSNQSSLNKFENLYERIYLDRKREAVKREIL